MNAVAHRAELNEIYGSFFLSGNEIAVKVRHIQEVVNYPESLTPMPLAPEFLIGLFNLRGMIVPIVDLRKLLGLEAVEGAASARASKVAILDCAGARIGFIFDATGEVLRPNEEELNPFQYEKGSKAGLIRGAIKLDGGNRLVQILDPEALVAIENIPQILDYNKARVSDGTFDKSRYSHRKKCISFTACGIRMAFEISGIHEIVNLPEIQHLTLESDLCVGLINLRGQVVSILDFPVLLKREGSKDQNPSDKKVIVLKLGNEYFGLVVDSVDGISSFAVDSVVPIPLLTKERSGMFQGCLMLEGLGEVLLLDHNGIISDDEVLRITQGHSRLFQGKGKESQSRAKAVSRKQAYISFRLKHHFGVPIQSAKEIINYTDEILAAPRMPAFVKGLLNLRGKLVAVIDARALYKMGGESAAPPGESKIIIFQKDQEQFGLVVEAVESILSVEEESKLKIPEMFMNGVDGDFHQDVQEVVQITGQDGAKNSLIILNVAHLLERIQREAVHTS